MRCETLGLDNMLVYAKDYNSLGDYQILNSFETNHKVLGLTAVNMALEILE